MEGGREGGQEEVQERERAAGPQEAEGELVTESRCRCGAAVPDGMSQLFLAKGQDGSGPRSSHKTSPSLPLPCLPEEL